MSNVPMLEFSRKRFERFKVAYEKAVADKLEQFTFDGHAFVTGFAKYVIEYLTQNFKE